MVDYRGDESHSNVFLGNIFGEVDLNLSWIDFDFSGTSKKTVIHGAFFSSEGVSVGVFVYQRGLLYIEREDMNGRIRTEV